VLAEAGGVPVHVSAPYGEWIMASKSRALLRALAAAAVAAIALADCGGNSGGSTNEGSSGGKTRTPSCGSSS
jgi:hypothetical protein